MTEFYAPNHTTVTLASGRKFRLRRGIQVIPDEIANSKEANKLGIKPVEEMTDAEYRMLGLKRPVAN